MLFYRDHFNIQKHSLQENKERILYFLFFGKTYQPYMFFRRIFYFQAGVTAAASERPVAPRHTVILDWALDIPTLVDHPCPILSIHRHHNPANARNTVRMMLRNRGRYQIRQQLRCFHHRHPLRLLGNRPRPPIHRIRRHHIATRNPPSQYQRPNQ